MAPVRLLTAKSDIYRAGATNKEVRSRVNDMTIEIMRLFYGLWMLGILVFSLNTLSSLLFDKAPWRTKAKAILILPLFLAIWPLSLFSKGGRKILLCKFNQL